MMLTVVGHATITRLVAARPVPARTIRAHATPGTESIQDAVASTVEGVSDDVAAAMMPDSVPEFPKVVKPESLKPPDQELPNLPLQAVPDKSVSGSSMVAPADAPKVPSPGIPGPEKLDMADILPDVKAQEPENSMADKMESMYSKATNMFQKMQPEAPDAKEAPDTTLASVDSALTAVSEKAEAVKIAAQEAATPVKKAVEAPTVSTLAPAPKSIPDAPVQIAQDAIPAVSAPDAAATAASVASDVGSVVTPSLEPASPGPLARAIEYADDMMDRAEGAVGSFLDNTTGQASSMIQNVSEGVSKNMPKSLPPLPQNLQGKVDVIGQNFANTKAVYDEAPGVYLLLATLAIGAASYAYWRFEYGGYKGVFTPVDLLESLNREDNVYVVDIRTEDEVKEKGVLDLKRRTRGKATNLPLVDVPDAVKGNIDNTQRLQLQLNAALVTSLNEVNRFTKIVVMDSRGTSVKSLARVITAQGYRGYMLKGGYSAWKAGGLATKFGSYAVTPADLLADKGEELSEAAEQTATQLRKPRNAAISLLVVAATVGLYTYPHESFRLLGVLGIELTILVKLLSYESPSAAVDDLTKGLESVRESFSNAKRQAADFAKVTQARTADVVVPAAPTKPVEPAQKSSPVSAVRENAAAEAVKDAQAALDRMMDSSGAVKSEPAPTAKGSTKTAGSVAPPKPADRKSGAEASKAVAKAPAWPASGGMVKKEDTPPKPVVDSLPYVSAQDAKKTRNQKQGSDGAKPAAPKK